MRALAGLDVDVPEDLEVVGDEADRRDEDAALAPGRERVELLEQIRPEPGLAGRARALERERPALEPGALRDEARGLEQLLLVGVSLLQDPGREAVRGEDDVRIGSADPGGKH